MKRAFSFNFMHKDHPLSATLANDLAKTESDYFFYTNRSMYTYCSDKRHV